MREKEGKEEEKDVVEEREEVKKGREEEGKKGKKRGKRNLWIGIGMVVMVVVGLHGWKEWAEQFARWVPSYEFEELPLFERVLELSEEELMLIYEQTGLTAVGLQRLEREGRLEELEVFHRAFFLEAREMTEEERGEMDLPLTVLPMHCFRNSPISWEEYVMDLEGERGFYLPMVPLENGDILLTPNSHSFGWRQGHSAIVVDGVEGVTLESVVLGTNSVTQWASKWQGFPAVIILRAREEGLGDEAARIAMEYLEDVPYILTIGVLSEKYRERESITGTNCSHLVWQAYEWAGVDIDGNGGIQVLPQDMAKSEELEVVQVWGVDPQVLWAGK